jgi:hypothetical protein
MVASSRGSTRRLRKNHQRSMITPMEITDSAINM